MPSPESPFLTPKQAADYLQCSVETLKRWRQDSKGPRHSKISRGTILYRQTWLDEYVDEIAYPLLTANMPAPSSDLFEPALVGGSPVTRVLKDIIRKGEHQASIPDLAPDDGQGFSAPLVNPAFASQDPEEPPQPPESPEPSSPDSSNPAPPSPPALEEPQGISGGAIDAPPGFPGLIRP